MSTPARRSRSDRDETPPADADRREQPVDDLPPEPGDLADRTQAASLDPDEPGDVGGDQDIDTAATDADVSKGRLEDRGRGRGDDGR